MLARGSDNRIEAAPLPEAARAAAQLARWNRPRRNRHPLFHNGGLGEMTPFPQHRSFLIDGILTAPVCAAWPVRTPWVCRSGERCNGIAGTAARDKLLAFRDVRGRTAQHAAERRCLWMHSPAFSGRVVTHESVTVTQYHLMLGVNDMTPPSPLRR